MTQVICVQCGAVFEARRRSKRYCSQQCQDAWRKAHQANCPGCGKRFAPARSSQVYCSPACGQRARRRRSYATQRNREVRAYRRTTGGRSTIAAATCPVCARVFAPERSSQVYCSPACRRARANAARTRAMSATSAVRACALIARMHVPDAEGRCAECAHPWPCETRRLATIDGGNDERAACIDQGDAGS